MWWSSSSSDDDGEPGSRTPRIVIDLMASPRRRKAGASLAAPESSASRSHTVIDLDTEDDGTLARQMQAEFDVVMLDDQPTAPAVGEVGGAIDFKALNEARQRRIARQQRLSSGSSSTAGEQLVDADLLYEQRRGLEARCVASAQQLKLRVTSIEHNGASKPGRPLYERFVAAWSRVPNNTLKIVFHATRDGNMESICRSGLNQKRRGSAFGQVGGAGEYFGREVAVSAPYSSGSRRMLVFAILMDRSGLTSTDRGHPGEIVINKSEHQLPLATVTFDRLPKAPLQFGSAWAGMPGMPQGAPGIVDSEADCSFPGTGRTLGGP